MEKESKLLNVISRFVNNWRMPIVSIGALGIVLAIFQFYISAQQDKYESKIAILNNEIAEFDRIAGSDSKIDIGSFIANEDDLIIPKDSEYFPEGFYSLKNAPEYKFSEGIDAVLDFDMYANLNLGEGFGDIFEFMSEIYPKIHKEGGFYKWSIDEEYLVTSGSNIDFGELKYRPEIIVTYTSVRKEVIEKKKKMLIELIRDKIYESIPEKMLLDKDPVTNEYIVISDDIKEKRKEIIVNREMKRIDKIIDAAFLRNSDNVTTSMSNLEMTMLRNIFPDISISLTGMAKNSSYMMEKYRVKASGITINGNSESTGYLEFENIRIPMSNGVFYIAIVNPYLSHPEKMRHKQSLERWFSYFRLIKK